MTFNRRNVLVVIGLGFALSLAAQHGETFKARLSALPADAKTRAELAGSGSASAVLVGSKLEITGSFDGLRSAATSASLHSAAMAGIRGPAIGDLTISKAASGALNGSIDLTPEEAASLHKGGLYVQIQSEKAPDGVLWGWFLK
jgi:hypothetical protein